MIRWGDVYGSVSEEVFSVGVSEETRGRNDKPVLSIRQPDTDDVYLVVVPGCVVVVVGCFHHYA